MSTAAPTISFSGLASGLDTTSIISQLTTTAQIPITNLNKQITGYNAQISDWQSLNTSLASLQSAVKTLANQSTLNVPAASSSNPAAATVTAQVGASFGSHTLAVSQLATAQEVVSAPQSSSTTALGKTGSFTLNGRAVLVASGDTLSDVAAKINAAGAGVSANVVAVGTNDYRLTLTSAKTGAANSLSAADTGTSTVLKSLGILTAGAGVIRQSVAFTQGGTAYTGAGSLSLLSATDAVGSLLGLAAGAAQSGTFHLTNGGTGAGNEADIAIDLSTDSLASVANAVNKAGIRGVSAEVVTVPDANGNLNRVHQLRIVGAAGATDPGGILTTLGILQSPYVSTVSAAQDAKFSLDGLELTRATNTVSDVVPGTAITLLSGTAATPATTTLSVSQNTAATVQAVTGFVSAYNAIQSFITRENKFTPPTNTALGAAGVSPALFGSTALAQIGQTLSSALTAVSGKNTLSSVGISLNGTGELAVDTNALSAALQADPNAVSNLFGLSGTSDSATVQFLGGSAKSAASSGTGYPVVVSRPASQASGTAAAASGSGAVSAAPETLTFGGGLFPGAGGTKLTVPAGSTVQQTAALINSTSSVNAQIYASVDAGNHLVISSQSYGSSGSFSVSSDAAASAANTGIGPALSVTAGQDVAGTIGGEAAVGTGRTLTGSFGNKRTEGVKLLVTATAPSSASAPAGHVTLTHGVADGLALALSQILDPATGAVAGAEDGLNSQVAAAQAQITKVQTTVDNYKAYLTQVFSQAETRISRLQAQGSAFTAAFGANNSNTSSGGSSAKSA